MDFTVGDPNCKFGDIAKLLVKTRVAGSVRNKLLQLLSDLDLDSDEVYNIGLRLRTDTATLFDSIFRGLEAWRAKFGSQATLSNLISVLKKCDLNDIVDTLTSTFYMVDPRSSKNRRFARMPEALIHALHSSDKLTIIKTTSQELLWDWISETAEQKVNLIVDIVSLFVQPKYSRSENLCIVTAKKDVSVTETLNKLKTLRNRIVLVTDQKIGDEDFIETLSTIPVLHHKVAWEDFTEDYQEILMNKPFLIGKLLTTTLSKILTDIGPISLSDTLNDQFMTGLTCGTAQLFPLRVPPVLSYYIERRLVPRNQISHSILNDASDNIFVLTGLTISELSNKIPNQTCDISTNQVLKQKLDARFIILVLYSDLDSICAKAKFAVHWLHYNDNKWNWVSSKKTMSGIQEYVITTNKRVAEDQFIDFLNNKQKSFPTKNSIILSDSPGMGKSVLLAKLAYTINVKYTDRIIIFVRLEEFIKQNMSIAYHKDLFDVFVTMACDGNKLSEAILRNMSKHKEKNSQIFVEIFIDGFDEVEANDRHIAEILLKTIHIKFSQGRVCLWVTTRPHMLEMLENSLNVLGYNIEPFLDTEQTRFLKLFWKDCANQSQGKTLDETRLEYFSNLCLSTVKARLGEQERDIAGIPLQCTLMAEAYSKNAIEYCDLTNVIVENAVPVINIHSMTDLYSHLINTKLEKYRRLFNITFSSWEKTKSKLIDLHVDISFRLIFPQTFNYATTALSSGDLHDLCNIGIVESNATEPIPRFLHRTFAEYFVALYVVNNLNGNDLLQTNLFRYIFRTTRYEYLVKDMKKSLNLRVLNTSFHQKVICFFINNFLAEKVGRGKNIPLFNVEMENMHRCITAALSEDFMFLFQMFTQRIKWPIYTTLLDNTFVSSSSMDMSYYSSNSHNVSVDSSLASRCDGGIDIGNFLYLTIRFSRVELIRVVLNDLKEFFGETFNTKMPRNKGITLLHVAVKFRTFEVVRELLQNWYHNLEDLHGLIHLCVQNTVDLDLSLVNEKIEILDLIHFEKPNYINTKFEGLVPVHLPNVHLRLELKLLALGADVNILSSIDGGTVLHKHMLLASNFQAFLMEILSSEKRKKDCIDLVLIKDNQGCTPLHKHISTWIPTPETLKLYTELGANFNSINKNGESIITSAIKCNQNYDDIRSLIDFGADFNWRNEQGESLLHIAVFEENIVVIKVLTDKRIDVNIQNKDGNTPLHDLMTFQQMKQSEQITAILFEKGSRLDIKNKKGYTPLDICLNHRHPCQPVLSTNLLAFICNNHKGFVSAMNRILEIIVLSTTDEVAEENLKLAKDLVQTGAELTFENREGNSLLFSAMELVCLPVVRWLVESGLQVNYQDWFGNTPLHHLMLLCEGHRNEEIEVFNYLQLCGALVNKSNFENETVMDIALKGKKRIFAHVCKTSKDKVYFCKNLGTATLHNLSLTMSFPQDCAFIEALVTQLSVNVKDDNDNTMLHHAAQKRSSEWVRYFLSIGASTQLQNAEMRHPIHMLYHKNSIENKTHPCFELVQMLIPIENNATINVTDWIKLHEAVCFGNTATFKSFLVNNMYHEYLFCDDFVWFVMACRSLDIISLFCKAYKSDGFNILNLGTDNATSALHVAVIQNEGLLVEYLLEEERFNEILQTPRMSNLIHKLVQDSCMSYGKILRDKTLTLDLLLTRERGLVNKICDGDTPLLVDKIHPDLIRLLIEHGADANAVNVDGDNLAHLAVQYLTPFQYYFFVQFLFSKGYRHLFRAKGKDECTVMHRVVSKRWIVVETLGILNYLKRRRVDFNSKYKNGQSVLVHAVKARINTKAKLKLILGLVEKGLCGTHYLPVLIMTTLC